ncbi:MAG: WYL domain-containing protein [Olsenella sp.]|nr:WYL domain-containing protein [Olsenella sp.]
MSREHGGEDAGERITRDDERARRIAGLLMAFSGSRRPLSSDEIRGVYYPELSSESFRRAFGRDREALAQCGMVVRNVSQSGEDGSWVVDEQRTFAEPSVLLPEEALTLDVACAPLVTDPDFPYRSDLRLALAKLDRHFGSATPVYVGGGAEGGGSVARELLECLAARTAVRVTYVDARGRESARVLAPYGSFGLNGNTYVVAAGEDATETGWGRPLTYRLDRFKSARRVDGRTYQVPEDFCLRDFLKLPFQAGPTVATCSFSLPSPLAPELREQMEGRGTWADGVDGGRTWTSDVSDLGLAASWAVASDIVPLAPKALVSRWRQVFEEALDAARDTSRDPDRPSPRPPLKTARTARHAKRMGRKGGIDEARELAALLGALSRQGDQVSASSVAARLGCDVNHARHLLMLVATSWDEEQLNLPLAYDEGDDTLTLAFGGGVRGRQLRLSLSETYALLAALDSIGVDGDDPIVARLRESVGAIGHPSPSSGELDRAMSPNVSGTTYETCVRAIADGMWLSFTYAAASGGTSLTRKVAPQALRSSDGRWYLDGFDLVRGGERTFRLDRMGTPQCETPEGRRSSPTAAADGGTKRVVVRFSSDALARSRNWNDLTVLARGEDGSVTTSLPWYGGTWLARNLASCGSGVVVEDAGLREAIADYCVAQLSKAR